MIGGNVAEAVEDNCQGARLDIARPSRDRMAQPSASARRCAVVIAGSIGLKAMSQRSSAAYSDRDRLFACHAGRIGIHRVSLYTSFRGDRIIEPGISRLPGLVSAPKLNINFVLWTIPE